MRYQYIRTGLNCPRGIALGLFSMRPGMPSGPSAMPCTYTPTKNATPVNSLANLGVQFLVLLTRNNAHAAALATAWDGASKGSNMCAAR
jgi:hypothetical protein